MCDDFKKQGDELRKEAHVLKEQLAEMKGKLAEVRGMDESLLIIVKNLPEKTNENVVNLVNSVIRESIKLKDIKVTEAVRKKSFRHDYPGVIDAKCVSVEEKRKIMSMKSELRNSKPQYKNIHIDNHISITVIT